MYSFSSYSKRMYQFQFKRAKLQCKCSLQWTAKYWIVDHHFKYQKKFSTARIISNRISHHLSSEIIFKNLYSLETSSFPLPPWNLLTLFYLETLSFLLLPWDHLTPNYRYWAAQKITVWYMKTAQNFNR